MDHVTTVATRPWVCAHPMGNGYCGARLLWRRTSVNCPTHGVRANLPAWPTIEDRQ